MPQGRLNVNVAESDLRRFCDRHAVMHLSVFGPVLRDDPGPASDIDVPVRFAPGRAPGWNFVSIAGDLAKRLGRPVALRTSDGVRPADRDRIPSSAQTIHAAA